LSFVDVLDRLDEVGLPEAEIDHLRLLDPPSEVVVIESRVDGFMAVLGEVGRLDTTWDRVPAVEDVDLSRGLFQAQGRTSGSREVPPPQKPFGSAGEGDRMSGSWACPGRPEAYKYRDR
jgi:hypothetical protein